MFYLLLTAYQNTTLLLKGTEGFSTMIGPLMLCMFKDECIYFTFPRFKRLPVDTGRKLNVDKTFRRRPGRLLNVLCTFNLRPAYTGLPTGICFRIRKIT